MTGAPLDPDAAAAAKGEAEEQARVQRNLGWHLLWRTLLEQKRALVLGVAIGVTWTAAKVAVPQLTKSAIDQGIERNGPLLAWSVFIALAGLATGLLTAGRRYLAFRESRWTETLLRERIFGHIQRLHVAYHDKAQTGQLMSRASSDLQQVQQFVVMIPITLSNVAQLFAVTVILALTDWRLAVVALAPLPFINVASRRFSSRIHPAVLEVQNEQAQLASVVEESVSGVRVVKGLGTESVQFDKLRQEADDIRRVSLKAASIRSRFLPAIDLLPSLGLIAVLGYGGHRVINGDMSIGDLVAFNVYLTMLVWPLRNIGMMVALGQRAAAALVRVHEVLSTQPAVRSPDKPRSLPVRTEVAMGASVATGVSAATGAVRFEAVHFGYDTDREILRGFDLSIAPGESVALVGATGAGKSTIVRLLLRFYDVTSGRITIDDVDLRRLDLGELRRNVGVVFEDTFLFNDSVRNNIAFAKPDADQSVVEHAARLAGAHDFINQLPDGYATQIGERGYSLSGGQRQRVAIARAIVADPRVLVLDDATSAVDPSKEHEIRDAMRTVMAGRTTIVIAHRPGTIALADRIVLLDEGVVAAVGQHRDLVESSERYREVLAAWAVRDAESEDGAESQDGAASNGDAKHSRIAAPAGGD
ncbi:MAG: ABC transporter ATP-binding protein [Acidimicrobiia bacterium]|nr:ABC transporter ATP-binding protein [Acidimicrobiia bacterium]